MARFLLIIISLLALPETLLADAKASNVYEQRLVTALDEIRTGNIDASINSLQSLVQQYPNSKVAHLLLADMFANRGGSPQMAQSFNSDPALESGLRDEIEIRWKHNKEFVPALSGLVPANLLQVRSDSDYVIVVDASKARLYVFKHNSGSFELVDHFYMTVGRLGMGKSVLGDLRTPIGIYTVTSYIAGETLPERYGPGAFPINYPNYYDKLKKRTGYGIWIHGTEPDNYNRTPLGSDGCVSLSNDAFIEVKQYISADSHTTVIIDKSFEWISNETLVKRRHLFNSYINDWKSAWERLDIDRFLAIYSKQDFITDIHDYNSWENRIRYTHRDAEAVKISLSDLQILRYPGEKNMVQVSFTQQYTSNSYSSSNSKIQLWKLNIDGDWKIVYES